MSASLQIPQYVEAKTPAELQNKILKIQASIGGKVGILSIYFASGKHYCWYQLPFNSGGGLF